MLGAASKIVAGMTGQWRLEKREQPGKFRNRISYESRQFIRSTLGSTLTGTFSYPELMLFMMQIPFFHQSKIFKKVSTW